MYLLESHLRALAAGVTILLGSLLAVSNFQNLFIEDSYFNIVFGAVIPVLLSVGVIGGGLVIWWQQWSATSAGRLTGWLVGGMLWMTLVGIGTVAYQIAEGVVLSNVWNLLVLFPTYGILPAVITGWFDIQRKRRTRSLRQTNQELQRNEDLLTNIEQLVEIGGWELDPATDSIEWTEGGRRIRGLDPTADLSFEEALDFYHGADRELLEQAIADCEEEGVSFELELKMDTRDETNRWVRVRGHRTLRDGEPVIRGAIQNITTQKEREQRIMVLNRVLRHNISNKLNVISGNAGLLAKRLQILADEASSRNDDRFGRDLSENSDLCHDLQLELREITAAYKQFSSTPFYDMVDKTKLIESASDDVVTIAEKTRRFEQAIEHGFIIGAVPVKPLIDEIVTEFRNQYPEVTIETSLDAAKVAGNTEAIEIVLDELIENAIEHNDRSDCEVSIHVHTTDEECVVLSIRDNGPGIPEEERTVLEAGNETPLMHGSGIGLWVVNWLTIRLNGSVSIREGSPRGTRVEVRLPSVARKADPDPTSRPASPNEAQSAPHQ